MTVSSLHEGLLELVRKQPGLVAELSQLVGIDVPPNATAQLSESTLNESVPAEYYADAAVIMAVDNAPVLGAIIEAQFEPRERKRYTWPHYATGARARHQCPCIVLVLAPSPAVARWARQPIDLGYGSVFQPQVIGPEQVPQVTDAREAARDLPLACLSATAHGNGDPATAAKIGLAVAQAASELEDRGQQLLYLALVENALSEAAKELLKMMPEAPKWFSETQRRSFNDGVAQGVAQGVPQGIAQGKAEALLRILARRGGTVTEEQQQRILACSDVATLDRWLDDALSSMSLEELLR